jgi:alpha-L-rhamnosidase
MPVFRREFVLKEKPAEAVLRIVGLGQWQATLADTDGTQLVEPEGLHGDWTDYRKTVTYDTVDVTSMMGAGKTVLAVMLGNGMYNVQRTALAGVPPRGTRYTKFAGSFGAPKMIAELDVRYPDGSSETIATDATWKAERGPVVFDSTYGGEDYDARREQRGWETAGFDDASWSTAQVVDRPGGELVPSIAPMVGEHERYAPVKQTDVGSGRVVYDLGQNFAGVVRVQVKGPAGAILRLTPGELLNPDGTVSQATFHGPMWWSYTLRGDAEGETWRPLFGYGGFRYVQVEWRPGMAVAKADVARPVGELVSLVGISQHSNSTVVGSFASSNEMLNRIHALIVAAMHNNEVSLLTDCPEREKLGWLEQTHLLAASLMFNSDLQTLFKAQDRNMVDAQWADGIVPTIAPQYTHFGPKNAVFDDSPEWGSASVLEPWWAYRYYGDKAELERDYPMMQRYVKALEAKAVDGIVAYGLGDWYDIGPGAPGFEKNTSLGVTATLMLYEDAVAMERIARLLGRDEDARSYGSLAKSTAQAFNHKFWDEKDGWYDRGSQTANAMPLALGVVPPERRVQVLEHLVADIHAHQDHVTTGEVGYPYLLRALAEGGHDDVILAMMLRKDPPSYGSQLQAGATSLTEAWDANPHSSQDHFMLGAAEEWFYRRLGGMDIDLSREDSAERLTVRPIAVKGVDWVRCGFDSKLGQIESDWNRAGGVVTYTVRVPVQATVVLPPGAVAARKQAKLLRSRGQASFRVEAGTWVFTVRE